MQEKLLTAGQVRARFGDISSMTLWRWIADPNLHFPRPIYIQRRRFFREAEIADWENSRQKSVA